MENHPIPQDVTGFKFRLIGSITVKQFLYLLGGGIFALLFYFFPIPFLLKLPLMLIPAVISLSLAFVPIDGRPMDKMIYNFAKAIPAENQYIYKKQGVEMPYFSFISPAHAAKQTAQLNSQDSAAVQKAKLFNELEKSYFKPDPEESQKVASISNLFNEGTAPSQGFTNRVIKADSKPIAPTAVAPVIPAAPEEMVQPHLPTENVKSEKKPMPETPQPPTPSAPTIAQPAASQAAPAPIAAGQPAVQQATPPSANASGIDIPNVLLGAVRDPRGKPVPHVIVEILDRNNTPLRTFRTDASGQFRAATPLPDGNYTIHLEDTLKKQDFEDVKLTLTGKILDPIEIVSVDQREKLRRELFGVAPHGATQTH